MSDKDEIQEEREALELAHDAESENREIAIKSLEFWRLGKQWDEKLAKAREGRPMLTINKGPAFIRQVVNDARMNRPQIKVKAADDFADPETAKVIEGLIRNTEYTSNADVAYDMALENACSLGWGYLRVGIEYAHDDSFDKTIKIKGVGNPFSVYGDPFSVECDSSDWNQAHVVERIKKTEFQRKYKGAEEVDWVTDGYAGLSHDVWRCDDEEITICEAWRREVVKRKILMLSNGMVIGQKEFEAATDYFGPLGISVVDEREANSYKITQRIMTGVEVIETSEWAGQYIPVVPAYGEEVNVEGKRMFFSMMHHAEDAQRMFNYWRTNATETIALSPRVPFIGEEGSFDADARWETANTQNHPYLMYKKGSQMPQRQPIDTGAAVGSMSEAMASSDDIKAIVGLHDASLGARSNETSGKAIMARQREGDVSTFHFIDNLSRAQRHLGRILIDLYPKIYTRKMVERVIGEDGKESRVTLGPKPEMSHQGEVQEGSDEQSRIYDLSVGRYDVAVTTGPGFTTRREETAMQMTEFVRSFPQAAPIIGDLLVKAMDWQYSDEIAERLKAMLPQQVQGGMPPELQKMIEQGKQQIEQLSGQVERLESSLMSEKLKGQSKDLEADTLRAELHLNKLMDGKMKAVQGMQSQMQPQQTQSPVSVNVPENIGEAVANAIVPAVTQAVANAVSNLPPLQVNMPPAQRMKRTPVRDGTGLILHTVDEPIMDEVMN